MRDQHDAIANRRAWVAVLDYLRDRIRSGILSPGTRLVELAIAEELGLSQGPVREALARLKRQGLVEGVPRRGRFVASVSVEAARNLYELRCRVEPLAGQLAMRTITVVDAEELAGLVRTLGSPTATTAARVDADVTFHRRVYELARFPTLLGLWEQFEIVTRRLALSRPVAEIGSTRAIHDAILGAIVTTDTVRLDEALGQHMRLTRAVVEDGSGFSTRPPADFQAEATEIEH